MRNAVNGFLQGQMVCFVVLLIAPEVRGDPLLVRDAVLWSSLGPDENSWFREFKG